MITHRILMLIGATWVMSLALWGAQVLGAHWGSDVPLICWLFGFAVYLGLVLLNLVDLERIEESQLPSDSPLFPLPLQFIRCSEHTHSGVQPNADDPPRPNLSAPPFRFVGLTERDRAIYCKCSVCEAARAAE